MREIGRALTAARGGQLEQLGTARMPAELAPLAHDWNAISAGLAARQRDLDTQLGRTALLTRLSIELRAALDPQIIIYDALLAISANTDAHSASIVLIGPDGTAAQAAAIGGGHVRAIAADRAQMLLERGLAGWVLRHGRNVALPDATADERWLSFGDGWQVGGALALQLKYGRATLGVLTITHPAQARFTSQDLLLFEGVAAQISVALGAARRHLDDRRRRDQALMLFSLGQFLTSERSAAELAAELLAQSVAVFEAQQAALFLADQPDGALGLFKDHPAPGASCAPATEPVAALAERAWRSQQICAGMLPAAPTSLGGTPAHSASAAAECAGVALPLLHNGLAIGVLVLLRRSRSAAVFSADTWPLLTVFANVAAAAFVNLRLVAQLRQRARALERQVDERTAELEQNRDRLRIIFDHLPDGLVLVNNEQQILMANEAFESLLGQPAGAVLGRHYPAIIRELEQTSALRAEQPWASQGPWRVLLRSAGGRERWYAIDRYSLPAAADGGRVIERWRDVTSQELLHHQLLQHEQLTTLARLAASVVHEVGNPLQSVRSCLDLCCEDGQLAGAAGEYLELASNELDRMAGILNRLRDLYRPPQLVWEYVDLNKLIVVVRHITARQFATHRIDVELDLSPELPLLRAQPDPLRQVLLNLLLNAQEAMPSGGRIRVATAYDGERQVSSISVADIGVGIAPERIGHLFEPFNSSKAQGLGLGLYISKQVIEQHHGTIEISSTPGSGTTVLVSLPWCKGEQDEQSYIIDR